MKNSSDTIGNRTRDLQACSEVLQPTVPLRALLPGADGEKAPAHNTGYKPSTVARKLYTPLKPFASSQKNDSDVYDLGREHVELAVQYSD